MPERRTTKEAQNAETRQRLDAAPATGHHAARADDTGLARKFNVTLTAACTLRDPRTGRSLWTDRRISVRREVFTDSGQLQAEYQTLALLTEALAARITSDLVETW